jgi:UDP-glucose 4-epimerase
MLTHTTNAPTTPARVVILGAAGFLGRNLAKKLHDDGSSVLPLARKDVDLSEATAGQKLAELLHSDDTVVFLSAITPDRGRDSSALLRNLKMGQAVAAAATAVRPRHLIYASSDAVYPFTDAIISENSAAAPVDLYGVMHRAREIMLAAEAATPFAVLRFTAIYGIGDTHNSYGPNRFIAQVLKENKIALIGNGEETRDHLYIDDAVDLLRRVIFRGSTGLLNVASGKSTTFRALADMIAESCSSVSIEALPRKSAVTHRRFNVADTLVAFPDFRFISLKDGLRANLPAQPRN